MTHDDMEMDFGTLFEASTSTAGGHSVLSGERIKGKVVLITSDTVFIDYGAKSEGWAELEEFQDDKGELSIQPGSEVELTFIEYGPSGAHLGSCLRKGSKGSGTDMLQKAFESGIFVEGTVTKTNKGGLEVSVSGTLVFCPFSQMDLTYCDRPEVFVGTTQKFKVIQFEEEGKNIVVSRRAVLQVERESTAARTREQLAVGEIFQGRVTRLTPFGAFVDLGGLEGLIHVSEISRSQVKNPSDVLSKDQEVTVQVLNFGSDEKGQERISLSMKALEPDPWDTDMDLAEGDLVMGTVRTLMPYGAFIEIIPGVEGLIHISEISYKRIHHPKDLLQEGQELEVKVLEINKEQRRISLSLKEVPVSAEADSAPPEQETIRSGNLIRRRVKAETSETTGLGDNGSGLPGFAEGKSATSPEKAVPLTPQVGLTVKGIIRSIKPYGYFVDLPDLGSHQRGLLHNSQLEVSDMGRALKGLKEGDEIQVEIIKIDDQGRISLSRKSILENQDRADLKDYRDQAKESGKFGTMADLFKKKSRR